MDKRHEKMTYTKGQILQAEELRKEIREVRWEHTLFFNGVEDAAGDKKEYLLRKLNKIRTRLSELNEDMLIVSPLPINPSQAINDLNGLYQQDFHDPYVWSRKRFIVCCKTDPDVAISFFLQDMMLARAKASFFMPLQMGLYQGLDIDKLRNVITEIKEQIMKEQIMKEPDVSDSFSPERTLIDVYRHNAALQIMGKDMCFISIFDRMNAIFAGVEVWQILNEL